MSVDLVTLVMVMAVATSIVGCGAIFLAGYAVGLAVGRRDARPRASGDDPPLFDTARGTPDEAMRAIQSGWAGHLEARGEKDRAAAVREQGPVSEQGTGDRARTDTIPGPL